MKKSSVIICIICGAITLVSVVVALINKGKKHKSDILQNDVDKRKAENEFPQVDSDFQQEKNQVANTILERHKFAAQVIKDTLEENNSYDVNDSKHKTDFDEIDKDLDMLLNEEEETNE